MKQQDARSASRDARHTCTFQLIYHSSHHQGPGKLKEGALVNGRGRICRPSCWRFESVAQNSESTCNILVAP